MTSTTEAARSEKDSNGARVGRLGDKVPMPVRRFVDWLRGSEFFTTSSSLAFYAMVSIPPMALIALWAAGTIVSDETLQNLGGDVDEGSPDALPIGEVVRSLVDLATRLGSTSVLAAVWPATAYGAALARAFSTIAPESERQIRGWKGRLLALGLIAALPLLVFGALATLYVIPRLLPSSGLVLHLALASSALVAFAAVVALIFSLYQVRDTSPSDVLLGAVTAAGLQVVVTGGYLLYLQYADFESKYGSTSLAVAVLLGFWLMLSNATLLSAYRVMLRRCQRRIDGTSPAAAREHQNIRAGSRAGR